MNKGVLEGVALLLVASVGVVDGLRLIAHTSVVEDVTGPGRYLFLISLLLGVASLVYIWEEYRRPAILVGRVESDSRVRNQLLLIVVALVAYVFLIEHVGYVVSTFAFVFVVMRILGRDSWIVTAAVSLAITAALYVVFIEMSGMIFPREVVLF